MPQSVLKFPVLVFICVLIFSCKKESAQEPEEEVPAITYPQTLQFVKVIADGEPLLYSNQHAVADLQAAKLFNEGASSFLQTFLPPQSLTFVSKDTVVVTFKTPMNTWTAAYGTHGGGDNYTLVFASGFTPRYEDTAMREVVLNTNTGLAHGVYGASGDMNELSLTAFAYRIRQYQMRNQEMQFRYEESSLIFSPFKMSYINSLTSLDTLGIQRYAVVYKR